LADKATPTGFLSVTFLLPGQKKGNNWFPLDPAQGMLFWLLFLCCWRQRKSNNPTMSKVEVTIYCNSIKNGEFMAFSLLILKFSTKILRLNF